MTAPGAGTVREVRVLAGDDVAAGEVLAILAAPLPAGEPGRPVEGSAATRDQAASAARDQAAAVEIRAPKEGRVVDVSTWAGAPVAAGAPLVTVAPVGGELEAVVVVPFTEGRRLRRGVEAQLLPAVGTARDSGHMLGIVTEVAEFPASPEAMLSVLANPRLVELCAPAGGQGLLVRVRPVADPASPGGYRWSARPPASQVRAGTLCTAAFVVAKLRPIELGPATGTVGQGQ